MTIDTTPPTLTSLSLPSNIDVSNGNATAHFGVGATDVGLGVNYVMVTLDRDYQLGYTATRYISFYGSNDSFSDGFSSADVTFSSATMPGTYNVSSIQVTDNASNVSTYSASDLIAKGLQTSFTVTGGQPDTTPPTLTSLSLPSNIDVSNGNATAHFGVGATDVGLGVNYVMVTLDRDYQLGYTATRYISFYGSNDSFSDGFSSADVTFSSATMPGTYNVSSIQVTDNASNVSTYSASDLIAKGLQTSFTVTGGQPDTTPPTLTSLSLPSNIDVSNGNATAHFGVGATDVGLGVNYVMVTLDRDYQLGYTATRYISFYGSNDSFSDGFSSADVTFSSATFAGRYNISSIQVTDSASNVSTYFASDLNSLGIKTYFSVLNNIQGQADGSSIYADDYSRSVSYSEHSRGVIIDLANGQSSDGLSGDKLYGFDSAIGSKYSDILISNSSTNLLQGLGGDDVFIASSNGGTLDGGTGNDTVRYDGSSHGMIIDLASQQTFDAVLRNGDKLVSIENAIGSQQSDFLVAGSSAGVLQGLGGDDVFVASSNGSTLDGGTGNDTVRYDGSAHGLIIDLASQQTFDAVLRNGDKLVSIENAIGSQQSDFLVAGSSAGVLQGLGGDDVFVASSNGSTLDGGTGNDTVRYDGSAHGLIIDLASQQTFDAVLRNGDKLVSIENVVGSQSADMFIAGSGATMTGLGGSDTFDFVRGLGHNYVTDFTSGQDVIQFSTHQFSDFSDVINSAQQIGENTVISVFDAAHAVVTETVELQNVVLLNLHSYDFHFV